jgi:hypothetical protein
MRAVRRTRVPAFALAAGLALACGHEQAGDEETPADSAAVDTLITAEQQAFAVDLDRFHEMQGGRLDTVDMIARGDGAAFHVQILNYTDEFTALTYAAWYTGPDAEVMLAADDQPRLEDELGNVYRGVVIAANPRFKVERGTTAVGVYVFRPGIASGADSLTLYVNDSTPPILRVGPFGVHHEAALREPSGGLRMRSRETDRDR